MAGYVAWEPRKSVNQEAGETGETEPRRSPARSTGFPVSRFTKSFFIAGDTSDGSADTDENRGR